MRPSTASINHRDICWGDPEKASNVFLEFAIYQSAFNLYNIGLRKFCARVVFTLLRWHETCRVGMFSVLGRGYVFEIAEMVIRLYSILVIDLIAIRPLAKKSARNKEVNVGEFFQRFTGEDNLGVSLPCKSRFQNVPYSCAKTLLVPTDKPTSGHRINTFIANYVPPRFGWTMTMRAKLKIGHAAFSRYRKSLVRAKPTSQLFGLVCLL